MAGLRLWGTRLGLILTLLGIALALAYLPLEWATLALIGGLIALIAAVRPTWLLPLLALSIPFGSIRELTVGGLTVGASEALIALALAGWLTRRIALRDQLPPWQYPPLTWPLIAFLGAGLLSYIPAASIVLAAKETLKWLEVLGLYLLIVNEVKPHERDTVVAAICIAGIGEALLGAYQFLTQTGPEHFILFDRYMRAYGTFEQPNPYGGYLGMSLPLAIALTLSWLDSDGRTTVPKWLATLGTGAAATMIAALGMSWSRGAWMGFAAAFLTIILLWSRKGPLLLSLGIGLIALIALLGSFQLLPPAITARFAEITAFLRPFDVRAVEVTDANYSLVERMAHWQAAAEMWRDHLWLGVGWGNYSVAYPQYALPKWPLALGHAHNYYLNIAAETGLIGLIAYLILWGTTAGLLLRRIRRTSGYSRLIQLGALGALVHVSVHNIVDNLWVHNLYLLMGLLIGLAEISALDNQRKTISINGGPFQA